MGISLINMSYINMFSTRLLLIEAKTWGEGDRGERGEGESMYMLYSTSNVGQIYQSIFRNVSSTSTFFRANSYI
jgi:hypothetical protein